MGLDKAVMYTVTARGWGSIAGVLTILAIARFLTREEQGYYYTFANLLAVQVFFEMGLAYVILQFASHERASLQWSADGLLEGDHAAKARLKTLMRFAVRWYAVIAALIMALVLPLGLVFFGTEHHTAASIQWQGPWIWFALVAALTIMLSPLLAMLEGCGLVPEVASIRLGQSLVGYIVLWAAMFLHMRLFAVPIYSTVVFLTGIGWVAIKYRRPLLNIYRYTNGSVHLNWKQEIWPFQWRIALSSISGYFIFQLFTPVLFKFRGAAEAGRMGMSISITSAVFALGMAWVTTKAAPFGMLVATKDYRKLDQMWFKCLWRSVGVVTAGGFALWLMVCYLNGIHHHLAARLLGPLPIGLLTGVSVLNQIVFAEAAYLRAHKQEPFLVISVIGALITGSSTYFLGRLFGANGMIIGYSVLTFLGLPVSTWIFLVKRRQWQAEAGYVPLHPQDCSAQTANTTT